MAYRGSRNYGNTHKHRGLPTAAECVEPCPFPAQHPPRPLSTTPCERLQKTDCTTGAGSLVCSSLLHCLPPLAQLIKQNVALHPSTCRFRNQRHFFPSFQLTMIWGTQMNPQVKIYHKLQALASVLKPSTWLNGGQCDFREVTSLVLCLSRKHTQGLCPVALVRMRDGRTCRYQVNIKCILKW